MTGELSPQARALLDRAVADERPLLPGVSQRARLKRNLLQGAALTTAVNAAAAPGAQLGAGSTLPVAASGVSLLKGVAAGLLVSGGLLGLAQLSSEPLSTHPAPAVGVASSVVASPSDVAAAASTGPTVVVSPSRNSVETPVGASTEPGRPPHREPAPSPPLASAAPGLARELELLNAAQSALRDGNAGRALALLDSYDQSFPRGQLLGERLAAEVFAACQLGERSRAARAAELFLQRDASSVLAARVQRSCAFQAGRKP